MAEGLGSAAAPPVNEFIDGFRSVIGLTSQQTEDLVTNLANEYFNPHSNYFVFMAQQLPILTLDLERNIVPISSGSFGQVSRITRDVGANHVLKEQRIGFNFDPHRHLTEDERKKAMVINSEIRDIFIEIFIQYTLARDTQYGANIVKLHNVYRSAANNAIYMVIDYVDMDMSKYFGNICTEYGVISNSTITYYLVKIAYILKHLNSRYDFVHRDLKLNNIGLRHNDEGMMNMLLFDFGASCMKYNGKRYSGQAFFKTVTQPCNINGDLALLVYSLYLIFYECLNINMVMFLEGLLSYNNLHKELAEIANKRKPSSQLHTIYNYEGVLFKDKYYQFAPANFIEYVNQFIRDQHLPPVLENGTTQIEYSVEENEEMEGGRKGATRKTRRRSLRRRSTRRRRV